MRVRLQVAMRARFWGVFGLGVETLTVYLALSSGVVGVSVIVGTEVVGARVGTGLGAGVGPYVGFVGAMVGAREICVVETSEIEYTEKSVFTEYCWATLSISSTSWGCVDALVGRSVG